MARKGKQVVGRGMKKDDLKQGGGFGDTVYIKKGDSVPLQFFHEPDDFLVFQEHQWEEDRKWFFVPCIGEDCPLCDDESDKRARTSYQWAAQVYDVKEKKAKVLKGGKDLGNRVWHRYERKPGSFTKRVFEVTKFASSPVTHDVSVEQDEKPVALSNIKPIDLEKWREEQLRSYYGDDIPKASDLDDDEDDDDLDDDLDDLDDLDDDEDDDLDDDEDDGDDDEDDDDLDDDEDDEDDDDEEPAPAPKKSSKKAKPKAKSKKR